MVPRFLTGLVEAPHAPVGTTVWRDTWVALPAEAPSSWQNVLTGQRLQVNGTLQAGDAMSDFPLALLRAGGSA